MIISFDLDGVIADTDPALLNRLHAAEQRQESGALYALIKYYASRQVRIHPAELLSEGDSAVIITGRLPMARPVTERWVCHFFGDRWPLVFVSDETVAALFAANEDDAAIGEIAKRKMGAIATFNVGLHVDNNPDIVGYLRAGGVVALQYGGSVWLPTDVPSGSSHPATPSVFR